MSLNQKQLYAASQLFMAAGKAGAAFDLGRFCNDPNYTNETLLGLLAGKPDSALQALIASTLLTLNPAPAAVHPPAPSAPKASEAALSAPNRYIGRLR
jgi:hypothetical protein